MAKKKKKRKEKKTNEEGAAGRGTCTPENFLFGFILATSLFFAFLCVQTYRKLPVHFSTVSLADSKISFEKDIRRMVGGYPIEKMAPYISRRNKKVASFLVAIAKKESNWGRHAPKKHGRECFNYWGYRGPENPTASGYSCFSSPKQAVNVVGGRIGRLVGEKIDTPQEMIIWKCGASCSVRDSRNAAQWVWDVGLYYKKLHPTAKKENKESEVTALHP